MIKVRCSICDQEMPGHSADWPDYPFCSPRCRKIDLGRWLGEKYRISTPESNEEDSAPPNDPSDDDVP
jgi:uncharacterized protein